MGGGDLGTYLVVQLVAVMQLAMYLFEMDVFELDALAIKSLISGTYTAYSNMCFYANNIYLPK